MQFEEVPIEKLVELPKEIITQLPVETLNKLPVEILTQLPIEALCKLPKETLCKLPVELINELPAEIINELPIELIEHDSEDETDSLIDVEEQGEDIIIQSIENHEEEMEPKWNPDIIEQVNEELSKWIEPVIDTPVKPLNTLGNFFYIYSEC